MKRALSFLLLMLAANAATAQWQPVENLYHSRPMSFTQLGDTVFAATGKHLFRSTDHGSSWTDIQTDLPSDDDYMTIIARNNALLMHSKYAIWNSIDGGMHWNKLAVDTIGINPIAFFQSDRYVFLTNTDLLRSSDNGASWQIVFEDTTFKVLTRAGCVVDSVLFVASNKAVYKSLDWGNSWEAIPKVRSQDYAFSWGHILFFSNFNYVIRSTDYGATWDTARNGNGTFYGMTALASVGNTLFAISQQNGLLRSLSNGKQWNRFDTMIVDKSILSLYSDGSSLYTVINSDWIYHSSDVANTWARSPGGLIDGLHVNALAATDKYIYAATNTGVYRSDDGGSSWKSKNIGLGTRSPIIVTAVDSLVSCYDNTSVCSSTSAGDSWMGMFSRAAFYFSYVDHTLFAGLSGLMLGSTDLGKTWPTMFIQSDTVLKFDISVFYKFGNRVLASGKCNGSPILFYSLDGGTRWYPTFPFGTEPIFIDHVTSIGSTLFGGTVGSGMYRSLDSGTTWTQINMGLGSLVIKSLTSDGTNLFAGTDNGVYVSTNMGTSWGASNYGLSDFSVNSLAVFNGFLYAGADDGAKFPKAVHGFYRRPIVELGVPKPTSGRLASFIVTSTSNPFSAETSLVVNCTGQTVLHLEIFDVLGKKVYDGGEKVYEIGMSTIALSGKALPKGVLYCKLSSASGEVRAVKIIGE